MPDCIEIGATLIFYTKRENTKIYAQGTDFCYFYIHYQSYVFEEA